MMAAIQKEMTLTDIVNAVFLKDSQVLLARRSTHRTAYAGRWSFPGGHVEAGETLDQALIREVREESAVTPTAFRKIATIADSKNANVVFHMYEVTDWIGVPKLIGDEHSSLQWFALADAMALEDLALPDYRHMFMTLSSC